ncbi:MAG: outer membrane lipoprotein-sorting protein [Alphaproteobacteria bacterium]|nr:outer membrane lipoprotein-sorting protein [Alphaproteobacteria bacterium]
MRNLNLLMCGVLMLVFSSAVFAQKLYAEDGDKGRQIAQAVYDRPTGKTMIALTTMVLEGTGKSRTRQFYAYSTDNGGGEKASLIRFTLPADVADTGLLTQSHASGEDDQWIYLPALKRIRRIAADRKGGRFVDSDIYYEDLQDRKVNKDSHKFLRQEKLEGALCDVIESIPVDPKNSSYSKRVVWVHPQTLIPIRVDFYRDNADAPIKTLNVKKIEKIDGFWTVMETVIKDYKANHTTRIKSENIIYDKQIPNELFSDSFLQDPSREKTYRP